MAATTYECSECGAQLKSPQVLPEGKKIRCPKCNEVFTISSAKASPAPKAAAAAPAKAAPAHKEDDDEGGSYGFAAQEVLVAPTDAELSGKKKTNDDEDEDADEDGDDDKPKKKKKKGFKKKKQSSGSGSGKMVALILCGVLLVLLLAGGGIGAYFYLNWYKNKGTGKEDPLALLPADSKMYAYINVGALSSQPSATSLVDKLLKGAGDDALIQRVKTGAGLETKDLMDQVYFGFTPPEPGKPGKPVTNVLFKSKVPFDQNKVRLALAEAEPERFKWRTYLKLKAATGPNLIYMASDRFILFSDGTEAALQALIEANSSQSSVSAEMSSTIQTMENTEAWVVLPIDENIRQGIKAAEAAPGMKMPAGVEAGMAKAKMVGMGANVASGQVKILASVHCADDASAKHLSEGFSSMWDKQKGMMGIAAGRMGKSGSVVVKDLTQTLHFTSKGPFAQSTAQVSLDAVKDLFTEAMANQPQPGAPPAGPRQGAPGAAGARRGGRGNRGGG